MGTMSQASDVTLKDFDGGEGYDGVLRVTRPKLVRDIHRAYLAARAVADEFTAAGGLIRWVLGSIGPGTRLPTLGRVTFRELRDSV